MGRVKEMLLEEDDNKTADYEYQFQLWRESKEYSNIVNDELEDSKLIYSTDDVRKAINAAFGAVQVTQTEVGLNVFNRLIEDRIFEQLNKN